MMLSRTSPHVAALARRAVASQQRGQLTTVAEAVRTAEDALKHSGYSSIDFTIDQDAKVYDAVQKFAAFNIGCLVTTDKEGESSRLVPFDFDAAVKFGGGRVASFVEWLFDSLTVSFRWAYRT